MQQYVWLASETESGACGVLASPRADAIALTQHISIEQPQSVPLPARAREARRARRPTPFKPTAHQRAFTGVAAAAERTAAAVPTAAA